MLYEKNNYHQIFNAYLQNELTIEKDVAVAINRVLEDGHKIRLVKNYFSFCFREARLSTTGASDIEHNKYIGQFSTVMRASTSNDEDLVSLFDKIDESEAQIVITSLHHHLINNHDIAADKGKIKGQLPFEHIFGSCRTLKRLLNI